MEKENLIKKAEGTRHKAQGETNRSNEDKFVPTDYVLDNLKMLLESDGRTFEEKVTAHAREITKRTFNGGVFVSGLLAMSSFCRNDCTYCGLRVSNRNIPRFRLPLDDIRNATDRLRESGIGRIFFVSGEDPGYPIDQILAMTAHAKSIGLHVTLGLGVYPEHVLREIHDAGADCFTLKFETSNREMFGKIKPTVNYDERMACIRNIKPVGMELGSGDIIGLEGQTVDDVADDILLMRELAIDWAPVVPYLPAPGTPMAETTPMGDVSRTLRVISLLRVLMNDIIITAGQPKQGSKAGFADPDGNRAALDAGGNILFVDVTPLAVRKDFDITPGRVLPGLAHVEKLLESTGLKAILA
ncbi:radical SAM protein [bacterium]|nr:radical SAM protein [bacterium]